MALRTTRKARPSKIKHEDVFTRWASEELHTPVVAEYRFHPTRLWRIDYALPQFRIALEVEGGVWTGGRHTRAQGFLADLTKYNALSVMGWRLLRTVPDKLMSTETIELLKAAMRAI